MRRLTMAGCVLALSLAPAPGAAQAPPASGSKLYHAACPAFSPRMTFDCYHSYDEVTAFLREAARQYPGLARLESMGKSFQGRDLWVLTVTDFSAGDPAGKPAMWVDGGIDADEVVSIEAALGVVHRLLTSSEPEVVELRRTRTFYVAPAVIPDISDLHHTTPIRPRDTTARPWDDDGDGLLDEDGPEDLDGDGEALQMRVPDPAGEWVKDERDPRAMRARRAGDAGPFYRLHAEGIDNDGDGRYNEDPIGGIDPNRNYPGNWSQSQAGAGPFPASEVEIRAMLDFALAHPNIAASQHFHSSGGVILRPPSVPDLRLPPADERLYVALSRQGLEVTGYNLATSVYDWNWPRGARNTRPGQVWRDRDGNVAGESAYPAFGGSIDGMYLLFGVLAFANEIYQMGADENGDGFIDQVEQLRFNDRALGGAAFRNWTPFDHPQLGRVEIGGWRKFGHNNPLPADLPREVRRNVDFVLVQAGHTPLLRIGDPRVESLGGGVYRVRVPVRNTGLQPTELAIREQQGTAVPVRASLAPGAGVDLLSSHARQDLGILGGYAQQEAEWLVRAPDGGSVTVTATHPKGGTTSATVTLAAGAR
jgi:hypothetical protein